MIQNTWAKGGAILSLCLAQGAFAQSAEGSGVMYRCPGNDYNNTISASEAEKLHCKRVENANVTVIRSPGKAASGATAVPAAPAVDAKMPAENTALRERASNVRRDLQGRLRSEERKLSALEVAFNGGEPERRKDETSLPAYLDRVANMRSRSACARSPIACWRPGRGRPAGWSRPCAALARRR